MYCWQVCVHDHERPGGWSMCRHGWFRLPLALRQRWWRETAYGEREPLPEIVGQVRAALAGRPA